MEVELGMYAPQDANVSDLRVVADLWVITNPCRVLSGKCDHEATTQTNTPLFSLSRYRSHDRITAYRIILYKKLMNELWY
jgi:hypothetical protein